MNVDNTFSGQENFEDQLRKIGCEVIDPGKKAILSNENPSSPSSIRPGKYTFFGPLEVKTYPEKSSLFLRAKAKATLLIDNEEHRVVDIFTISSLVSSLSTCQIGNDRFSGNTLLNRREYSNLSQIDKKKRFIEEFVIGKEIEIIEANKPNVITWKWAGSVSDSFGEQSSGCTT